MDTNSRTFWSSNQNHTCMTTTTLEHIDEEINKYLGLVSNLHTQKNTFLPVFHLPPETLANVFTIVSCNHHKSNNCSALHVPHWVSISYVCHHWHDVTLNCLMLWTYYFAILLHWTEELLARSKQASLKICIKYDYDRANSWWLLLLEKVLNYAGWIQELHLNVPGDLLPAELSLNAPCL